MKELILKSTITVCQMDELTDAERHLIDLAILATTRSYAPYSHFSVGAALSLESGRTFMGCNQENAAFPVSICAERAALFAAGAECPDEPVVALAIAARDATGALLAQPITPCGSCRQAIVETETRQGRRPVRLLLYGTSQVYVVDGIGQLMPLSFTEF